MPSRFEDWIEQFGDAQLISYAFENKELRFQLYDAGARRMVSFFVPTDTVHGRTISAEPRRSTGTLKLIELARRLDIRNERYFPPAEARLLLADAADRVMLAYGRRCTDCRWLLSFRGEYPLLCCLIRDLAGVRWGLE